ncbi:MAG TPA: TIGR03013 family XrtA/PEP-CTERM system glycosyltransferase [Candidatus Binatus sp.]|nr:TIGR03013 family XrtA/PEP-CTERM system glycosyltransferase [Candidatus Binatus sp.]
MIRLFILYPVRTLVLLVVEALVVGSSFLLAIWFSNPETNWIVLNVEGGYLKIVGVTAIVLLLSHGLVQYDSSGLGAKWDQVFQLFMVLGLVAFSLAAVDFLYGRFLPDRVFLPGVKWGLVVLAVMLLGWRGAYSWIVQQPYFRERVYVLGTGDRAQRLLNGLRQRSELGIEVVGWTGDIEGELTRETVAAHLVGLARDRGVHRVIVAMPDRRGTLPVEELLNMRLAGVKVEEATSWLEKISGRIEVEQLYPSWLIFVEGFRFSSFFRMVRRGLSFALALVGLIAALPLLPFIVLAVKLGSSGPALYRQKRVGRGGSTFYCYKFRTMRQDAEADTGATWATDDDPRITRVGKVLRTSRLDEIPQLWCVLKGDMHFVGPRPERPEFVEWLSREIPYYGVRHMVRPGITGWAQVQYKYGNTVDDAREKLQYDLFYIKNASLGLDFLILFQTIKIVLLGRGAQ